MLSVLSSRPSSFPVLQMMNKVFGGSVHKKSVREDGVFNVALDNTCSLFRWVCSHGGVLLMKDE